MLNVVGKLFGRVLIKRVRAGTECAIGEEQSGFRQGKGCVDQVFAVRQVCESISQILKMYFGRLWIWKRPIILSIDMVSAPVVWGIRIQPTFALVRVVRGD